ncbi:MAG: hypothetical protein KIT84_13770 [Labilithrix sp.]|nr:hypothetical protein [Labilithrix sp.]MCW5812087.1 hypothetical protein [Labilithrix sp.]
MSKGTETPGLFVFTREAQGVWSFKVEAATVSFAASLSEWTGLSGERDVVRANGNGRRAEVTPLNAPGPTLVLAFVAKTGAAPSFVGAPIFQSLGAVGNTVGHAGVHLITDGGVGIPTASWSWTGTSSWTAVAVNFRKQ